MLFEKLVLRALGMILENLIRKGGEYDNDKCRRILNDIEVYLTKEKNNE